MLYNHIQLHNTYTNICRNIVNNNDDFNERTNTILYKNISLTLYSRKGWFSLCVRGELETGTDCYILTQVLLTIAALLSHLVWVGQPWVTEGRKPPVCKLIQTLASCPQLAPTDSSRLFPGYIIVYVHLLLLFFRLFIQVHLLIDGSVEGQYVTITHKSWYVIKRRNRNLSIYPF